ncbi:uncharacterized protein LOC115589362 [Sparus aurata]|uniref:uncharacterized protein LOC115589362 n=1 Tax=Sparus aurata TaxID=8175 RepID=UPI0011C14961|nr:uncharacterized protein LOC115589362 [Sparus aurata]
MSNCTGFLLQETPPRVPGILEGGNILEQNRYKPICQTLNNLRSFVTLYDTTNRIPVFSASKYKGSKPGRPKIWNIEPQTSLQLNNKCEKNMRQSHKYKLYENQAGECDYLNNSQQLDRGHLFPSSYGHTQNVKKSTFTLTNAVPQADRFNQGSRKNMEECIKCVMDDYCINSNDQVEGFLVIGAQPGNNKLNNRVNIPSMLWSAFCCYSQSKGWLASAHWGQNIPGGDKYLQTKTLDELHNKLSTPSSRFEVFPGTQCSLNTTVTQFYPEVNSKKREKQKCNCPPLISTISAAPTTTSAPPV